MHPTEEFGNSFTGAHARSYTLLPLRGVNRMRFARYGQHRFLFRRAGLLLNLSALRLDPLIHLLRQQIQRDCAYIQYEVVILPQRKLVAERFPGLLTKLDDFQLTDHV